jgi:hypothetical protein
VVYTTQYTFYINSLQARLWRYCEVIATKSTTDGQKCLPARWVPPKCDRYLPIRFVNSSVTPAMEKHDDARATPRCNRIRHCAVPASNSTTYRGRVRRRSAAPCTLYHDVRGARRTRKVVPGGSRVFADRSVSIVYRGVARAMAIVLGLKLCRRLGGGVREARPNPLVRGSTASVRSVRARSLECDTASHRNESSHRVK